MPREITDFSVKLISLVAKGANNKNIIYKDENFSELLRVDFKKSDEEQGVVYGVVYAPDEVDSQGEFAGVKTIKKAAYEFMKHADMAYCVDVNHNFNLANAYICESWIVKSKDEFFDEVGAWAVGIKLEDERLREMVKNGELTGLSMYGSGVVKEDKTSVAETVKSALADFFKKNKKEETMDKEELKKAIEDGIGGFKSELETLKEELKKANEEIAALKTELSKSKQDMAVATSQKQDEYNGYL